MTGETPWAILDRMGRPPLPVGTFGRIRLYASGQNWRARTLYRDVDGQTRAVERTRATKAGAERALREALRDRVLAPSIGDIRLDTKLSVVAETWWADFAESDRSPGTMRVYRDRLNNQIIPRLGSVRCCELTVGVAEHFLRAVERRHGPSLTRTVRTVLSSICGYAVRCDAMIRNPVRDTSAVRLKPKNGVVTALAVEQIKQLRALLSYDERAVSRDLPALVEVMTATGIRIGEALAIVWDTVDLNASTIEIRGTVVRIKGRGLIIKPKPKTEAGYRTLVVPGWCREVLDIRRSDADRNWGELDLVLPSAAGTLRDPSSVNHQLKDAFTVAGFPSITSHAFRKTVATLMDLAGLSARAGADQLGHAQVSMTQDAYWARRFSNTGAAAVLEALSLE